MGGHHSKPKPEHWSVPNNNYLNDPYIVSANKGLDPVFATTIGGSDPAYGCGKNFTASYTCGTDPTLHSVMIDPEANGKVATFDCQNQSMKCVGGRLWIDDTGNATLKDSAGNTLWQSNTNKTGLALKQFSASQTKYKRNYLEAGEYLRVNEMVGSPSGNCYLQCGEWGGKLNLMIGYQVLACNQPGQEPDPKTYGEYGFVNGTGYAGATYSMSQGVQNHNLQGTVGYSDNNINIRRYPKNLISLDNDYFNLGNYNTPGVPNIQYLENTDVDGCKDACNSRDDCYGFVMGDNKCWLKPQDNYPINLNRVPNDGTSLYVRKMKVKNDISCRKDVVQTYGQVYANMPSGPTMTETTLCQLGEATSRQLQIVAAREKELRANLDELNTGIKSLSRQGQKLDKKMLRSLKQMEKESEQYQATLDETVREKDRLHNSAAMEEESNLDMISSNMHFIAWTTVAALAVAGGIKASR